MRASAAAWTSASVVGLADAEAHGAQRPLRRDTHGAEHAVQREAGHTGRKPPVQIIPERPQPSYAPGQPPSRQYRRGAQTHDVGDVLGARAQAPLLPRPRQ